MKIEVNEKFYLLTHEDGFIEIVRRDVYWDSGWKDPLQVATCKIVEAILEDDNGNI